MKSTKILFILSSYFFLLGLSCIPNAWIFFGEASIFQTLLILFLFFHTFYFYKFSYFQKKMEGMISSTTFLFLVFLLTLFTFFSFPIRSLELGDGILLIENLILETKAFGYTVVPDELLEGFAHSLLYKSLLPFTENPMISYRILSTICGALFVSILLFPYRKQKNTPLAIVLLLSNGGSLLFYGYMENYVWVTLFISTTILYGIGSIQSETYNISSILFISFLAAISAITHLISGFMILGLVYYCVVKSKSQGTTNDRNALGSRFLWNLLKNSFYAGLVAISVILPLYLYFSFFSQLRIDGSTAHASHPPFLSPKKILSLSHFYDLGLEAIFVAFPSIVSLLYAFLFEKKTFLEFFHSHPGRFLSFMFLGFFIHFFTYNPLLGYPADWDLMGFIWIPLFLGNYILLSKHKEIYMELLPLYIFLGFFMIYTAHNLSKKKNEEEKIQFLSQSIESYLPKFKSIEPTIPPHHKKMFLHTDYFLFRTHQTLSHSKETLLLAENVALQKEFNDPTLLDDQKRWKDFLLRATEFHLKFLKRKEER